MSRARATALALVNWKGVFYERYLLDPNVTALEGANGAGKTTVMVAAYVVLLPDLSKLRFSNVGESGGGGGDRGLRGRLGDPARPSYAAMEYECADGERFVAGVHLAPHGAELTLTPFSFTGVPLDGRLKELLLVTTDEHDEVPELAQVRERARELGGTLTTYPSAKEYFAALFERGVFPLRMQIDEERRNWNELLRTSMSGGISRALTSELRSFLLKEETGLSDTLQRMRETLDACRRTRAEVRESTRLEGEIGGVYESGLAMFQAAAEGFHALHQGTERALAGARDAARRSQLAKDEALVELEAARRREATAHERLASSRTQEATRIADEAARVRTRALEAEVRALQAATQAAREHEAASQRTLERMQAALTAATAERAAARTLYEESAVGLSDLQEGLEELHNVVHLARRRRELGQRIASLQTAHVELEPQRVREQVAELDARLVGLERRQAGQQLGRHQYESAFELLRRLEPDVAPAEAPARAAAVVAAHAHDLARADLVTPRRQELARVRTEVDAYQAAVELAYAAEIEVGPGATTRTRTALGDARAVRAGHEREIDEATRRLATLAALEATHEAELAERRATLPAQAAGHARIADLRAHFEAPTATALELRGLLGSRTLVLERERHAAQAALTENERWLERLEVESGVPEEVARVADALGAELLASRFDEVDDAAAARLEAELGSLVRGIVVDDLAAAVRTLAKTDRPAHEELVLVRSDAPLAIGQRSTLKDGDIWVDEPWGLRIVHAGHSGVLGRVRRQTRATEVNAAIAHHRGELTALASLEQQLQEWTQILESAGAIELAVATPQEQLAEVEGALAAVRIEVASLRARIDARRIDVQALETRAAQLEALAEHVRLLEVPSPEVRLAGALQLFEEARAAEDRVASRSRDVAELSFVADVLRELPVTAEDLHEKLQHARTLRDAAAQLLSTTTALEELGAAPRDEDVRAAEAALENGTGARATTRALWQERQTALQRAEVAVSAAESATTDATTAWQRASLEHELNARQLAERTAAWQASEPAASQSALFDAVIDLPAAERELEASMTARVRAEERARTTHDAAAAARSWETESEESAGEKREVFTAFERDTQAANLAYEPPAELLRDYKECFSEASSRGRLLVDRLQSARGGATTAERIEALVREGGFVAAWLQARSWLTERLPLALADLPDPHSALDRLRTQLSELEATLSRQEDSLRGASGDVARGIDVRVRRAKATVRRMNQHLGKVQFGSVSAIRVDLVRVTKMDAVLEALREGKAQELLFDPSMPLEQAFEEIFKRFAGGGRGADRLLDYREYLELAVMVQRRGKSEWEIATPARLSTGEAIGVGASLLMVVLTEWEQASQMFRKAHSGSLRFLFLDEANRLSGDNLGVLFELCEKLELQLLLAAPEVAQAHGNTTYRLVRRVDETGKEEVVVSGRRVT